MLPLTNFLPCKDSKFPAWMLVFRSFLDPFPLSFLSGVQTVKAGEGWRDWWPNDLCKGQQGHLKKQSTLRLFACQILQKEERESFGRRKLSLCLRCKHCPRCTKSLHHSALFDRLQTIVAKTTVVCGKFSISLMTEALKLRIISEV